MKKIVMISIALVLTFQVAAQERKSPRSENIHAEIGGPGLFTFNYDTRFKEGGKGWGARAGLGYIANDSYKLFTIPVGINYLLGNEQDGKYFELGANATFTSSEDNWFEDDDDPENDGNHVLGSLVFGYRKQPIDGGFTFRAGLSPYFGSDFFYPFVPYLSFGYAF
ncbi:hypothetical protein [Echinicola vietnamensis]|uniref:Outer membrane protein beta-barrel domain-containing protein n=1 Tax=Echinicola vietnamensis (strain DSM 17526 / LMG 23754 / KMM 6221) TaxID=926556 RepID=L0G1J6_ECHVK|nr:hypothetical protein [Echinicola vietnamensis]AGA78725.1 hypothetical protein Echvi_2478 [Echinicola vietnamensis DSM 17526]